MNDAAFRKRDNDFSKRDSSFSLKETEIRKSSKEFGKKEADTKKESIFDVLEKESDEAGKETFTGFRKKQTKKVSFRKRKDIKLKTSGYFDNRPDAISYSFAADSNKDYVIHYMSGKRRSTDSGTLENRQDNRYENRPESKRIKKAKSRMIINRSKQSVKRNAQRIDSYLSDDIEKSTDINSPEYKGNPKTETEYAEKSFKGIMHMVGAAAAAIIKVFVSAFTSIIGMILITATLIIGGTIIIIQNVTYDFIVDEDKFFRENISQISSEFTDDITSYANENGCTRIVVTGELADWKNVIAFFWTVKNNQSKHEQYENILSGDDYTDLKEIFNEFNEVSYEIEETDEEKVLKVNITNKSLEDMEKYWLFSTEQKIYLENLIATDDLWDGIIGMNALATMAYTELGQTGDKYYSILSLSEGDEWSIAFVYYLLNECGFLGNNYIRKTSSIDAFKQYCTANNWLTMMPEIGDIAFIKINGDNRLGIISNMDDDFIYIILGNYDKTGLVKEIYVSKSSGILTGAFAHIDMPDVISMINSNSLYTIGNGECLWPVPGRYYVTSLYGARWGTIHEGLDISCPEGTPIVASRSGKVLSSYYSSSAGEYIVLDHEDGMCTEYMHNSLRLVSTGDYVEAGQVIAYSGNTGYSTGPHCHFGVRINGERVDPAPYLGIPSQIGDVSQYVIGE